MRNPFRTAVAAVCVSLLLPFPVMADVLQLQSPNARAQIEFELQDGGTARYRVRYRDQLVIDSSALGLDLGDAGKLGQGLHLLGSKRSAHDQRYTLPVGKRREAHDHYRQLRVRLADADGRKLDVLMRAYDDGIALRYVLPDAGQLRIRNELTEFAFPRDYPCWALNLGRFGTSHEGEYDPIAASRIRPHHLLELPVVCQTDSHGTTVAIAEADLRNYAGLYLTGREDGGLGVNAKLSPRLDQPQWAVAYDAQGKDFQTPWRVVLLGDTAGKLIESTLIENLNPPSAIADTSWIKPGKSAWDWWSGRLAPDVPDAGMNNATLRRYIDHAHQLSLQYLLIDDGWYYGSTGNGQYHVGADILRAVPAVDLPQLVEYARRREVGLWLWVHWRALDTHMDQALALYQRLGIKGIKVDFMDRDDQQMVDFYHRLLAKAADHKLLVDLHGAYHPTGLVRTYPNYLTQEGVLGAEYNKWSTRITSRHNLTLPFTRMLLGPMDYTPGGFRNVAPAQFQWRNDAPLVKSTRAQQLAMYVVYDSPFAVVADSPDQYVDVPAAQFLRDVPASWDETRVLSGTIGEQIAIARRSGRDWFIGAMSNEQPRTLALPLEFLGGGHWQATLYTDGGSPSAVQIDTRRIDAATRTLNVALAADGGAAIRLTPTP